MPKGTVNASADRNRAALSKGAFILGRAVMSTTTDRTSSSDQGLVSFLDYGRPRIGRWLSDPGLSWRVSAMERAH
jgi:hypothetical protein